MLGSALGWSDGFTILAAIGLAFLFGYALTLRPLLRAGTPFAHAIRLALAADTLSIAVMEIVDNAIMLVVPGAMDAPPTSVLFWTTLIAALALAGLAAWPVNRWLIARGRGHAVVHGAHGGSASHEPPHRPPGHSHH